MTTATSRATGRIRRMGAFSGAIGRRDGNLVLAEDGRWWAVYKLRTVHGDEGKREVFEVLRAGLGALSTRAKILAPARPVDAAAYAERLRSVGREDSGQEFARYCDGVEETLAERRPWTREPYLAVDLRGNTAGGLGQAASRAVLRVLDRLGGDRGGDGGEEDLERARQTSRVVAGRFGKLIGRPASDEDLNFLVARAAHGPLDPLPAGDPANLGYRRDGSRMEVFRGDGRRFFQRFLTVARFPLASLAFPGSEWAHLPEPADLLLDLLIDPRVGGAGRYGEPGVLCRTTLRVVGETPDELEKLTQDTVRFYDSMQIGLKPCPRPLRAWADLLPVGPRGIPAPRQRMSPSTVAGGMPVAADALGDGEGFYVGSLKSQPRSVVAYDPGLPLRRNMSGGSCFVGGCPSERAAAAAAIAGLSALAGNQCLIVDLGGRGAAPDADVLGAVPALADRVRTVGFGPGEGTSASIFSVYPPDQPRRTEELLRGFLIDALGADKPLANTVRLVVREFVRPGSDAGGWARRPSGLAGRLLGRFLGRRGGPRSLTVAGLIEAFRRAAKDPRRSATVRAQAQEALAHVEGLVADPLASTVLCDADGAPATGASLARSKDHPVTVVRAEGLPLPARKDPGEGLDPSCAAVDAQRIGRAVLSVVAATAFQAASRRRLETRKPFVHVLIHGAERLLANVNGAHLLDYLIREGRSQNVGVSLCTDRWEALEPLLGLLPVRFMGRPEDRDEALRGLRAMGADTDRRNLYAAEDLADDEFLHQDLYGRVGAMRFEAAAALRREKPRQRDGAGPG